MEKYKIQLNRCQQIIHQICDMINSQHIQSEAISYNELYSELYQLLPLIPDEYHIFRNRLRDHILPYLKTPDLISINNFGQQIVKPRNGIISFAFGETIATITYLIKFNIHNPSSIWDSIHPQIIAVAIESFEDGHYAAAVEAAFKELTTRVKNIYQKRTNIEKDGVKLMQAAFSAQDPIIKLGDISTETGRNTQQGYMEMYAGAMMGIRNPQAHNNQSVSKSSAIRKLHFASMLMFKLEHELI